ncbi:MAG TPA: hypothetical protein VG711_10135 [Phycisphaerales bacterium]|nr:hypothetical protein [Phycisphaerales bacterium]
MIRCAAGESRKTIDVFERVVMNITQGTGMIGSFCAKMEAVEIGESAERSIAPAWNFYSRGWQGGSAEMDGGWKMNESKAGDLTGETGLIASS